ncbi:MAG TPA: acetate--CoA ligase family protein [Variovorax sp.]|nr:acetate--CoA ligase family protein [Variovorax sp.]
MASISLPTRATTAGQATSEPDLLALAGDLMGQSGCYDSLVVFLAAAGTSKALWQSFGQALLQTRQRYPDMVVAVCTLLSVQDRRQVDEAGIPVFVDPTAAIRTVGAISQPRDLAPLPPVAPLDASMQAVLAGKGALSEARALDLLGQAGIPVVPHAECATADAAARALERFGGEAVAVKLLSPDVLHKSDIGGVKLNVRSEEQVRRAFDDIIASARKHCPGARLDGVLVAPMVGEGVECILGVHSDPVFGPVVTVGLGGVLVEVLRDVSFRLAPFDRATAREMIDSLKGAAVLHGARGKPPCDVDALADALVKLSQFAAAAGPALASVDINPLLVLPAGRGVMAVDAVVVPAPACGE